VPDGGQTGAGRGLDGVPDGGARRGPHGGHTGVPDGGHTGAGRGLDGGWTGCPTGVPDGGNAGAGRGARWGPHGGHTGADGVADGRIIYF
jgi:hypothetical protein